MPDKIINADDMGISASVNQAIVQAYQQGVLNSTSLMVNRPATDEAIALLKQNPGLAVGVHVELKRWYVTLMALALLRPRALQREVEACMRQQLDKARAAGLVIAHMDSHRYVHMIPVIFQVAKRLQAEYSIPRLRIVNEQWWRSVRGSGSWSFLYDGAACKYGLLKLFYYLNRTPGDTYFYGLLYTGKLWGRNVARITVPKKYRAVEIAVHPWIHNRELDTVLDRTLPDRITWA
jgi:hypothetical protein